MWSRGVVAWSLGSRGRLTAVNCGRNQRSERWAGRGDGARTVARATGVGHKWGATRHVGALGVGLRAQLISTSSSVQCTQVRVHQSAARICQRQVTREASAASEAQRTFITLNSECRNTAQYCTAGVQRRSRRAERAASVVLVARCSSAQPTLPLKSERVGR